MLSNEHTGIRQDGGLILFSAGGRGALRLWAPSLCMTLLTISQIRHSEIWPIWENWLKPVYVGSNTHFSET